MNKAEELKPEIITELKKRAEKFKANNPEHTINWLMEQENRIILALTDGDLDDARELFLKYQKVRNEMLDALIKIITRLSNQEEQP